MKTMRMVSRAWMKKSIIVDFKRLLLRKKILS